MDLAPLQWLQLTLHPARTRGTCSRTSPTSAWAFVSDGAFLGKHLHQPSQPGPSPYGWDGWSYPACLPCLFRCVGLDSASFRTPTGGTIEQPGSSSTHKPIVHATQHPHDIHVYLCSTVWRFESNHALPGRRHPPTARATPPVRRRPMRLPRAGC